MKQNKKHISKSKGESIFVIIAKAVGLCAFATFCIFYSGEKGPIEREAAVSYSGEFESYDSSKNYCGINFKDGSYYAVDAHSEENDFKKTMKSLKSGTMLHILVNPNNRYVIEIKTDTEELLNFKSSQEAIQREATLWFWFGIFLYVASFLMIVIAAAEKIIIRRKLNG